MYVAANICLRTKERIWNRSKFKLAAFQSNKISELICSVLVDDNLSVSETLCALKLLLLLCVTFALYLEC